MSYAIVYALEHVCTFLDRFNGLGCLIGFTSLAFRLDERWNTGYWMPAEPADYNSTVPDVKIRA